MTQNITKPTLNVFEQVVQDIVESMQNDYATLDLDNLSECIDGFVPVFYIDQMKMLQDLPDEYMQEPIDYADGYTVTLADVMSKIITMALYDKALELLEL